MNSITLRNKLQSEFDNYSHYLPECHYQFKRKLIERMKELSDRIEEIKSYGRNELHQHLDLVEIEFESEMNVVCLK